MLRYVHRGVFRTQSNICDSVFCENSLRLISADFFLKKSSLTDVWLVSKYACGFRNSHRHPVEKSVLKNFIIFTGKHLRWLEFLFNKVADLLPVFGLNTSISLYQYLSVFSLNTGKRSANLWKRLQHKFFPLNITIFIRATVLKNICTTLLLWFITRIMQGGATEKFYSAIFTSEAVCLSFSKMRILHW